jgi:hypothetical protein
MTESVSKKDVRRLEEKFRSVFIVYPQICFEDQLEKCICNFFYTNTAAIQYTTMARPAAQGPHFTGTNQLIVPAQLLKVLPATGPAISPADAQYGCEKDYGGHTSAAGESHYWGIALGVNKKRLLPGEICCTAKFE